MEGHGDRKSLYFDLLEDKSDHSTLAQRLVESTGCPVAVPNYRLSPRSADQGPPFRHPGHSEDLLQFLHFILTWQPDNESIASDANVLFDRSKLYLIGHSCSAHMLSSIILDSSHITPSLTPNSDLLDAVQGIILSEGIYDIDRLLASFPDYREMFIVNAFGDLPSYVDFSVATYRERPRAEHTKYRWIIIHSSGDTLVDSVQSEAMVDHLKSISGPSAVASSFRELDQEHDAILQAPQYIQLIADFISS
ncbi:hypothetical protein AAF712_001359 [Marasmius tenuissimus]|uniref:Uncharacterized protein n=1 Tax=Marasmius tenuissimus TaxID=585030 RepID=A0ABR3AFZ5_9AGAR